MLQRKDFLRFCVVGGIGFITDASVLAFLLGNEVSHYTARALSFPVAVLTTWWLNRIWTFSQADRSKTGKQVMRYLTVQCLGVTVNFMFYFAVLLFIEPTTANAVFALAVGSAAALIVNYIGSRIHVFRPTEPA